MKKTNLTTWGEKDVDSRDEEVKENEAHLCLMTLDNEIDDVYNSNLSCSNNDDDIDDLYNKLYGSLVKAKKDLKSKIAKKFI